MTPITQLKEWFVRGAKPLQAHFHAWLDSYWHKEEKIPFSAIEDNPNIGDSISDVDEAGFVDDSELVSGSKLRSLFGLIKYKFQRTNEALDRKADLNIFSTFYWNKGNDISANLLTSKPEIAATNYIGDIATTSNSTFSNIITLTRAIDGEVAFTGANTFRLKMKFAANRAANIQFAFECRKNNETGEIIGTAANNTTSVIPIAGNSNYTDVITYEVDLSLNDGVVLSTGDSLFVQLKTKQANSPALRLRFFCGVDVGGANEYCLSYINSQNAQVNSGNIADKAITVPKLANDVLAKFDEKFDKANIAQELGDDADKVVSQAALNGIIGLETPYQVIMLADGVGKITLKRTAIGIVILDFNGIVK
ncbi:MAG: hypothetical protein ACRC9X_05260 [Bacteroidales bacterium]